MVTGEIGTGKTTICRNLLNELDDDETEVAFIFNPALNSRRAAQEAINAEFGIPARCRHGARTRRGAERLPAYDAAARGTNCVLVIDEAQNLAPHGAGTDPAAVEPGDGDRRSCLQIILIGQPELAEQLALATNCASSTSASRRATTSRR
jgi:general secretion pathway protein A